MEVNDEAVKYMFDSCLLNDLDVEQYGIPVSKDDPLSYLKPAEGLILRPLSTKDFQKGKTRNCF